MRRENQVIDPLSPYSRALKKIEESGIRPTKQRIDICEVLFNRKNTFHFTINDLSTLLEKKLSNKIINGCISITVQEKRTQLKNRKLEVRWLGIYIPRF